MRHRFKVCTGAHYLGGFIGDDKSKRDGLKERTHAWERKIHTARETAGKYTQESYAGVVRSIQLERPFIYRVTDNTGDAFMGVEEMLRETFLPRLFLVKSKSFSPIVVNISTIPVKKSGLDLLNPMTSV